MPISDLEWHGREINVAAAVQRMTVQKRTIQVRYVTDVDPRLPPVIRVCPYNRTAVRGQPVVLQCAVVVHDRDLTPSVEWYHDRQPLSLDTSRSARLTLSSTGSLMITGILTTSSCTRIERIRSIDEQEVT